MSKNVKLISPCLWFDGQAEQAAQHYTAIFPNSRLLDVTHYGAAGAQVSGQPKGSVMTVTFELNGQYFMGLNGGPLFKFSEAVSFMVECAKQQEIDYYWERLSAGGQKSHCGWLKDKFGLSWQIVPTAMDEWMRDPASAERVMAAVLQMQKLDLALLEKAARG